MATDSDSNYIAKPRPLCFVLVGFVYRAARPVTITKFLASSYFIEQLLPACCDSIRWLLGTRSTWQKRATEATNCIGSGPLGYLDGIGRRPFSLCDNDSGSFEAG